MSTLRIENLNKHFGHLHVLKDFSALFSNHKVIALIGPNGSGKTTLIKCILGLVMPESGRIMVNEQLVHHSWNYRKAIGYMPQINRFPDHIKVRQVFEMIKDIRGHENHLDDELFQHFELQKQEEKKMNSLSGGTRQKVNAALAFLFQPEILILDEPTAGLDPAAVELLKVKVAEYRSNGRLIIMTTHNLNDVEEMADSVLLLADGELKFFDSLSELKSRTGSEKLSSAVIKAYAAYDRN